MLNKMTMNTIKERPILFSGAMVRALLAGTKTQTRQIMQSQPITKPSEPARKFDWYALGGFGWWAGQEDFLKEMAMGHHCPYGRPGDRLWVRETHAINPFFDGNHELAPQYLYQADGLAENHKGLWKPSIFMPRAASRLLLEITAVRCERLQDISEADAIAEGISGNWAGYYHYRLKMNLDYCSAIKSYTSLWESINGPASWAANPWVWVVEFKRVEA